MTATPFVAREHVRWGDVDLAGVVRYDAFLRFVEFAEGEFFRTLGYPLADLYGRGDVWLPRRMLHLDYLAPARLDELLRVAVTVARIGESSLALDFAVARDADGTPLATINEVLVCVDDAFRKRRLPDDLRASLEAYAKA